MGPERAADLLAAGCNDMGGSIMNESITKAAGTGPRHAGLACNWAPSCCGRLWHTCAPWMLLMPQVGSVTLVSIVASMIPLGRDVPECWG